MTCVQGELLLLRIMLMRSLSHSKSGNVSKYVQGSVKKEVAMIVVHKL
jgi:hypothetical protein